MAQVINTNVAALFAGAALNKSAIALQTAQQRLSSGLRINSAKDDPTGLVIATNYDSQVRGTNIAIQGANNAISTAQTNDGYAGQIIANLQRLYEIAVQLGGTASGAEATALTTENSRIAALTKAASPVTYVDKNDPPFLIIHGEKDQLVSTKQSQLLSSWLNVVGVQNELVIVKDAPHFGEMFDSDEVRNKVMNFLRERLK